MKDILRDKTIMLPISVVGLIFFPTFVPIQNPVNILDEENDVLIEDVEVSERK